MCNLNLFYFCRKDKFERKQKRKASETVTSESTTENTSKDSHSIKKRKTDHIEKGSEVSVKSIKVNEGMDSMGVNQKEKKKKKKKVITGDGNAGSADIPVVVKSELKEKETPLNQHAHKCTDSKSNAKQLKEKQSDKAMKLSGENLLNSKGASQQPGINDGKKKKKKKRKKNKDGPSMLTSGSSVVDDQQNVKGSKQNLLSAKAGKSTESDKAKDASVVQKKKREQKTVSDDQSENVELEATSDQTNSDGQKSAAERLGEKGEVKDSDQGKSERKGKRRKKKKKKKGDGLPKLSAERLLAYGINPKKLKYIKRDNYKGVTKSS